MNYFELFDLPPGPSVSRQALSKKYIELQKKYHPDFNLDENDADKELILQRSADVNKAYKIFQDEDRTLEYFLQTVGIAEADEKYELPPEFLMEMMEMNESLLEKEREDAKQEVKKYGSELFAEAKPVIDNYWNGVTDGPSLQKLKSYYYKKKYLKRILDRLGD